MLARKKMSPFFVRFWAHFRNKNNNIEMYILLHATILFHIISQNITKHGHAKNHTKYFICNILWRVKVSNMKCTPRLENEPHECALSTTIFTYPVLIRSMYFEFA